jgi:basigin
MMFFWTSFITLSGCLGYVMSVTYQDITAATTDKAIALNCTGQGPFKWTLDDKLIEGNTNTYEITSSTETGTYTCTNADEAQVVFVALNPPAPEIKEKHGKSIIFYDTDTNQTLTCSVANLSPLNPSMTWAADQDIDLVDEPKDFYDNGNDSVSQLVLSQVTASSRGTYECSVTYTIDGSDFQSVKKVDVNIRVHSGMEALWPFLGILAEVLIIIVIVYMDHSRRKKSKEESGDEADGTNDVGNNSSVRKRSK